MASLREFISESSGEGCAVFVALHGGAGEDGRLQALLEEAGAVFTGPGSASCRLCMDKAATGAALAGLAAEGVFSARKRTVARGELEAASETPEAAEALWEALQADLAAPPGGGEPLLPAAAVCLSAPTARGGGSVCLKPIADGCSTGVACVRKPADLRLYAQAVATGAPHLTLLQPPPENAAAFTGGHAAARPPAAGAAAPLRLEMPVPAPPTFLAEPFIETDPVRVVRCADGHGEALSWRGEVSRLLEVTAGVVRRSDTSLHQHRKHNLVLF